jgi:hypothetical protein
VPVPILAGEFPVTHSIQHISAGTATRLQECHARFDRAGQSTAKYEIILGHCCLRTQPGRGTSFLAFHPESATAAHYRLDTCNLLAGRDHCFGVSSATDNSQYEPVPKGSEIGADRSGYGIIRKLSPGAILFDLAIIVSRTEGIAAAPRETMPIIWKKV